MSSTKYLYEGSGDNIIGATVTYLDGTTRTLEVFEFVRNLCSEKGDKPIMIDVYTKGDDREGIRGFCEELVQDMDSSLTYSVLEGAKSWSIVMDKKSEKSLNLQSKVRYSGTYLARIMRLMEGSITGTRTEVFKLDGHIEDDLVSTFAVGEVLMSMEKIDD